MQTLLFRQAWALIALLAFLALADREQRASAEIRLSLADGQQLTADRIGPETDAQVLAARIERPGIVMTRKIPWSKIRSVQINEQPIAVAELRSRFAGRAEPPEGEPLGFRQERSSAEVEQATETGAPVPEGWHSEGWPFPPTVVAHPAPCLPPPPFPIIARPPGFAGVPIEARVIGVRRDPISAYADAAAQRFPYGIPLSEAGFATELLRARTAAETLAPYAVPPLVPVVAPPVVPIPDGPVEPVQSISIDARAASSRGNVDWDVLKVAIQALNASGHPVPVRGTLQATLWGRAQRLVPVYDEQFFGEPEQRRRIAEWTRTVDSDGGEPEILTLPFPAPLAAHDETLFPLATLHVRLLAPGRGRFDATQEALLVRPVSPFRDEVWRETGSLFLPRELMQGRRNTSSSVGYRTPSVLRPDSRILTVEP